MMHRREFVKHAAVLGTSALVARGQAGANSRITIGVIGAGGRGNALMSQIRELAQGQNVRIAAVCDVWQKNLRAAAAKIKSWFGEEPRQFTRYSDLLALPGLDAVTIATPDFSHGTILVAALEANKDVYVEKPMTIDLPSANQALDLARAKNRVVQAGTQYRSDGRHLGARKIMASGAIGTLSRVAVEMNFNQERWVRDVSDCRKEDVDWEAFSLGRLKVPFNPRLLRCWQLYRATSNGLPGLWMTHYADATHMLTGAGYPASAVAHGGIYVWKSGREHTDTFRALVDYPEGFLLSWGMALGNSAGTHFTLHGTKGTIDAQQWTVSNAGSTDKEIKTKPIAPEPGPSHMENWLTCLRTRERPVADIQYGHQHTVATIMAAEALQTGRRQKYDPQGRKLVAG